MTKHTISTMHTVRVKGPALFILAVAILLTACGGKQNNPTPTPTPNTPTSIVGTWHIRTAVDYGGHVPYTMPLTAVDTTADYTFGSNGTFSVTVNTPGTWILTPTLTGGTYTNVLLADPVSPKDESGNVILSSRQVIAANYASGAEFFPAGPIVFTNTTNTICNLYANGVLLLMNKQK